MQNKFQKSILLDQKYELNTSVSYNLIIRNKWFFLKSALSEGECVTLASFKISMIIAKYQKPFSDGEFVKECFLESGATLYSDYSNKNSIMKQIENL